LSAGERLATLAGPTAVLGIQSQHTAGQQTPQTVYNLEVQGQHVFRVTSNGLLVHNMCAPGRALTVFDPVFAAKQTLKGGRVHADDLRRLIPDGTPNTFRPSSTIADGSKFRFNVNGKRVEIKWHAPDANAAARFPSSRSGSQWTAQIKIGNKLLGSDGVLYRRPSDLTHIPIDF
jgi:hypothetical protein